MSKSRSHTTARLRRIRNRLWAENPHCHWCGKRTRLYLKVGGGRSEPDQATLDHLFSKLDPRRYAQGEMERHVLACYECNWRRGLEEQQRAQSEGNPQSFDSEKRRGGDEQAA